MAVYANLLLCCTINVLLKFIILHFNNFILLRPENLYVVLSRQNELPEDGIFIVETRRSTLFVIIVFDIIVQSLVKTVNKLPSLSDQESFVYLLSVYIFFYNITVVQKAISFRKPERPASLPSGSRWTVRKKLRSANTSNAVSVRQTQPR